jgi:hypothetical protein
MSQNAVDLFLSCVDAMDGDVLIERPSAQDKEFAVQNWVGARLADAGLELTAQGRNIYPDFPLADDPEGFEVKSLGFPGRDSNYDANSQVPAGDHNGRTVHYVFARYPARATGSYAVHDLVICHGDFLNADREYVHKNDSFRDFGSYGDIMVRDRKMYVVRTPYHIASGLAGHRTLILPASAGDIDGLEIVGRLIRVEAEEVAVAYTFDLTTNDLQVHKQPNPTAGRSHTFNAYRPEGEDGPVVALN